MSEKTGFFEQTLVSGITPGISTRKIEGVSGANAAWRRPGKFPIDNKSRRAAYQVSSIKYQVSSIKYQVSSNYTFPFLNRVNYPIVYISLFSFFSGYRAKFAFIYQFAVGKFQFICKE